MAMKANSIPASARVQTSFPMTPLAREFFARQGQKVAGCPLGVDPADWREALERRINRHLAATDRLLAVLDELDGDPDTEASLGWTATIAQDRLAGGAVDLEADYGNFAGDDPRFWNGVDAGDEPDEVR